MVLGDSRHHPAASVPAAGRVLGVGWAKTGTKTLGKCLELLGFDHVTTRLDLVDCLASGSLQPVFDVADAHESFEDWPWLLLYREIDERYPGSRFIVTLRDDDAWIKSYRNMVSQQAVDPLLEKRRRILYGFDVRGATDHQLVQRRREHEQSVREFFSDQPGKLLEVCWEAGSGWAELCGFLGRPAPNVEFPHENRGQYG